MGRLSILGAAMAAVETADAVVVGGGLHGCSAALHLAMRGMRLVVVEKDHVGRHASGVNAGGVRRLGRDLAELAISSRSAEIWLRIQELIDDDCDFRSGGQIMVAESEDDLEILGRRVAEVQALGFTHEEMIKQDDLRALVPAISEHCVGGILVRGDGQANPMRTTQAFKAKAASLGVRFQEGVAVQGARFKDGVWRLETTAGIFEAPVVINCAGAWGDRVAEMLGDHVTVVPRAPMLMITHAMPPFVVPVLGATSRALSFKQFDNGTVLIGGDLQGIAHRDSNTTELVMRTLAGAAQTAQDLFPIMRGAKVIRFWAGIEGYMPDGIPVIGRGRRSGVFHAFGFSAHGFQMAPAVGSILAELVCDGIPGLPIEAFRIDRFAAERAMEPAL
jgi:sarcosine oxidase subunit beta